MKLLVATLVLIAVAWLFYTLSSTIIIIIISALIAYILDPVSTYLELKGFSRVQSTSIVFISIAFIFASIIYFLLPPLITEFRTIESVMSSDSSNEYFLRIEQMIQDKIPFIGGDSLNFQNRLNEMISSLSDSFFTIISSLVSVVTTVVIIPFVVFFLLKDGPQMKKSFVQFIPNRYFEMVLNILYKTDRQIGGYLRGQFIDASIIGLLAIGALWAMDVKYFLLIGIFAGLANMIPYVGPLVGATAAIFVVIFNGGDSNQLMFVAGAFVIIQLLDNVLVQPLIVARSVNQHPLVIIFAVIIGGQFFGILGMLLAVPFAGTLKVLGKELYLGIKNYNIL